jgi:hypothetical protein
MKRPAVFPLCLAVVVLLLPYIFHTGMVPAAISNAIAGVVLVGVAFAGHSWPARIAQALCGIWIAVGPFLLDGPDFLLYAAVIMGKVIALSALMPPGMFDEEPSPSPTDAP